MFRLFSLFLCLLFCSGCEAAPSLEVASVQNVWDQAEHAAFTDLIRFRDTWYLAFRESDTHQWGDDGVIRLLRSSNGSQWETAALFAEEGIDLRDPKLSETPDGRLMLLMGGTVYNNEHRYVSRQPRVAFSSDGVHWSEAERILAPHDWLWRITWHEGIAYGVSYRPENPAQPAGEWVATLYRSANGRDYEPVCVLDIPEHPSEATLRFCNDGTMVMLIRRSGEAWIGTAQAPFTHWEWRGAGYQIGGPNFVPAADNKWIAVGRFFDWGEGDEVSACTGIAWMTLDGVERALDLPSGGDTSYPGLVWHEGQLWISYYSSHEGRSQIYLARVTFTL